MPDFNASTTAGVVPKGYREGTTATDPWSQYVVVRKDRIESFSGRAGSFRIAGAAGTTGQKLLTIHNASASVVVDVETIALDVYQTAARVVEPPVLRLHRISGTAPTGGSALTKVPNDTTLTSNASVTLLQASSAERATAAITATLGSIITQEPVARALTLVGYEQFDRIEFINDSRPVVLRQNEGVCLNLDYNQAASNPITDMYTCVVRWSEWTRP